MERREFFRPLAGVPLIARPAQKNKRAHHQNERIYHGPMRLPEQVLDIATRARAYRNTHGHPVIRLALDGVTYLFRTGIAGDCYVGEIVITPENALRVHVWKAAGDAPSLADILARKKDRLGDIRAAPHLTAHAEELPLIEAPDLADILPPVSPPQPSWKKFAPR